MDKEIEYERSFHKVRLWEIIWVIVLAICLIFGTNETFTNRVDKSPPFLLTKDNYQEFLEVNASIKTVEGDYGTCLLQVATVNNYYNFYKVKIEVLVYTENGIKAENPVTFEANNISGAFWDSKSYRVKLVPLEKGTFTNDNNSMECICEIISISGNIYYEG